MRSWFGITALAFTLFLSGCAGYKLGPTNRTVAGAFSIQITPFANRTLEPRLSDALTSALRKEVQRDGTFQLATDGSGDVVVTGEILRYERGEVSFLPVDVVTARDFRVSFTAHVLAKNRITGQVLVDRELTGSTLMRVGTDLPSVERQTLPLLAADLARQINAAIADGSW